MGKIKQYLIELTEMFSDLLGYTRDWEEAKKLMKDKLEPDEYKFFESHEDFIREMINSEEDDTLDEEFIMKPLKSINEDK